LLNKAIKKQGMGLDVFYLAETLVVVDQDVPLKKED
jgi:hypothetical protein